MKSIAVVDLKTDRLVSPSDIGQKPLFSWRMESERAGASQTAYRITLFKADAEVWDSGEVFSSTSVDIPCEAPTLEPMTAYRWHVAVRDENGEWAESAEGHFSTGLFGTGAWNGSIWISASDSPVRSDDSSAHSTSYKQEAEDGTALFVKKVANGKAVREAWWCVTGLGVFDVFVGGRRVGEDFLKPGFTHFAKTKRSYCYCITDLLKKGALDENEFSAYVSAGWWRDKIVNFRGKRSAFRAVLVLRHDDGTETRVGTDTSWNACGVAGPVIRAAIFDGEDYDARIPLDPGQAKAPAVENTEFKGEILPMTGSRISMRDDIALDPVEAYVWAGVENASDGFFGRVKVVRRFDCSKREPVTLDKGETLIVDFGQNCAAVPQFVFSAPRGVTLCAHPAEMLNDGCGSRKRGCDGPEGSAYIENYRKARTLVHYTFAGTGDETYHPSFSFFGGRYLSITTDGPVTIKSVRWIPTTSLAAADETAWLETGDKDVNRLVSNIRWGHRSNYLSVPTDCPQRNERLGWTADTQVFTAAACYGADVRGFMRKWLRDLRDSRLPNGSYTGVAPTAQYGCDLGEQLGWSDAGVIVPWTLWKHFGDKNAIEENWLAMVRYVALLEETKFNSPDARSHQWADWLSFEKLESCGGGASETLPDGSKRPSADAILLWRYLGNCYWLMDAGMMADMAEGTGRTAEAAAYREMAVRARNYIRENFTADDGLLIPLFRDMQTPALFALKLGILDEKPAKATRDALLANIHQNGDRLKTGFLGTSILMDTITRDCGAPEVAYTLLLQHDFPSWLYSVEQGATTIWERWNSYTKKDGFGPVGMNSFNHYAYGAVFAWMMGSMAGIRPDAAQPGFRSFVLAPVPDSRIGHVSARYRSPYGMICSAWRCENGRCNWRFCVPPNTSALVELPDREPRRYAPGQYEIEFAI